MIEAFSYLFPSVCSQLEQLWLPHFPNTLHALTQQIGLLEKFCQFLFRAYIFTGQSIRLFLVFRTLFPIRSCLRVQ